jgi:hypothetical protein
MPKRGAVLAAHRTRKALTDRARAALGQVYPTYVYPPPVDVFRSHRCRCGARVARDTAWCGEACRADAYQRIEALSGRG